VDIQKEQVDDKVMGRRLEYKFPVPASRKRKRTIISLVCLIVLICILPVGILKNTSGNRLPPPVVIRLDDIQDYAFKDAQLFLLEHSMTDNVPLSLAVIAGMFGEDGEIVEKARLAVSMGSEVTSHGWLHEDFTAFSGEEQAELLLKSKQRIQEIFNVETTVFVPPMFKFSGDTLRAMKEDGYTVISTFAQNLGPGPIDDLLSLPGTVQLADLVGEVWNVKSVALLKEEIADSIDMYGFAVVITHPQEFLTDGKLDPSKTAIYEELVKEIRDNYTLETMTQLSKNFQLK
jgi:peptidoglycan/xylan/chitin deacetylase (PgdA/CDA1 family)